MELNWNFLGGGRCKAKTFHEGAGMDIFWKHTMYNVYALFPVGTHALYVKAQ